MRAVERPWPWLVLLCAALYLPGLASLPVTDRDEARFAQATRQMIESGDYVVVRFQDELRAKKPAGIHWLQAAAVRAARAPPGAIWPYRVPSTLGALATVLFAYFVGERLFGRAAAFAAAATLACSLTLVLEAHLATTDAVLAATTTAATGALGIAYVRERTGMVASPGVAILFWIATAAGILVKGPITPAVAALTALALSIADRRVDWLRVVRPGLGLVLCAVLVLPWAVAVSERTGGAFLVRAVQEDLLPKLTGGHEGHGAPPGYYTLLAPLLLWPGSLFVAPALVHAWRERARPSVRFVLAWLLPAWAMFELVPTKLPHYVLPLAPSACLLVGAWLAAPCDESRGVEPRAPRWASAWSALWAAFGLALATALAIAPAHLGSGSGAAFRVAAGVVVLGVLASLRAWRGRPATALTVALAAAALTYAGMFAGARGALGLLWFTERVVAAAREAAPGGRLIVAGDGEPSFVFLGGTDVELTDAAGAACRMASRPGSVAAVEERVRPAFERALGGRNDVRERGVVDGLDYSDGRRVHFRIYVRDPR